MFATVMCLVLPMCILISCSTVLCVLIDGLGYIYVCESYLVLDECDEPPPPPSLLVCVPCICVWWCNKVFFGDLAFCEFCFLYCDDVPPPQHTPSISSTQGPNPFFCFIGGFINNGKILRSPKMSTNFWQLSAPSFPDMAWFNTLMALIRDIFFSLNIYNEEIN